MSLYPRYGRYGGKHYHSRRSMALITVLLMIAVISITVIAFVVTMQLHKTASFSYSQAFKADQVAQGGAWWTVKELQEEIAAGAVGFNPVSTVNGVPLYINLWQTNTMPAYVGTNPAMPSLVKTSTNGTSAYFYTAASPYHGGVLPSPISTSIPSLNGRKIDAARWSEPCLGTFPSSDAADPYWIMVTRSGPVSVTSPSTQLPNFANPQDPVNYVIGRYAYAVYDEGGLIDINVAGYPSTYVDSSTNALADLARKGSPGLMDLTAIPGMTSTQVQTLFSWRNAGSGASMSSYTNYLYNTNLTTTSGPEGTVLQATNSFGTTNNYLYVSPGDNFFLSRQDLIAYATANGMTNILPYVTTFSRDVNAPSFTPYTKFTSVQLGNLTAATAATSDGPSTNAIPFPTAYPQSGTTTNNPSIALVRQISGQSLVAQRFPLSRLGLFNNPSANSAAISNYFGLTLNADGYSFNYYPSSTGIQTLGQVATNSPARSPNYFELLQSAVLQGSLGPDGSAFNAGGTLLPATQSAWASATAMQMGLNIIDQYTTNNWPTLVSFNSEVYAGNKSLPFLNEFLEWTYRPQHDMSGSLTNRADMLMMCPVEFWNPYQNATNVPSNGPTNLRLLLEPGGATNNALTVYWGNTGMTTNGPSTNNFYTNTALPFTNISTGSTNAASYVSPVAFNYPSGTADTNKPAVIFTNTTVFSEPTILTNATSSVNSSSGASYWTSYTDPSGTGVTNSVYGFLVGYTTNLPDARIVKSMYTNLNTAYQYTSSGLVGANAGNVGFLVQFQDTSGNWHPYQGYSGNAAVTTQITQTSFFVGQGDMGYTETSRSPYGYTPVNSTYYFTNFYFYAKSAGLADPRADLWGMPFTQATPNLSLRPNTTTAGAQRGRNGDYGGYAFGQSYPFLFGGGNQAGPSPSYFPYEGMFNENTNNNPFAAAAGWATLTNTYQYDNDGIPRPGDGYLGTNGNPYLANNSVSFAARPIILNRPFRSVGEMGFAFRGQAPWKSVNFFSGNSGDSGLLDLFGNDVAPLVAGKINLNTRQPVTLQAAIQGAYITENPLTTLQSTQASNFAQAIVTYTETGNGGSPSQFNNRADLVRQFTANSAFTGANGLATADATVKSHREAFIRPLAELGTTRTWNLLIDVVAQVGHYSPAARTATSGNAAQYLGSQFIVEGERRYWLHVAIDRVTGQVVDYKLELYNE